MDPYLESPTLWPDVHHGLISHIQKSLNPALRPRDVARVELRVYISDLIDEEIEEARLEIRHLETGSLVTVIEVLSPTNKIRGARGRASFIDKRRETLASEVHWVEIDLLRIGVPSVTNPPLAPSDYRILVSRAGHRKTARYWPVNIRQPLPVIGVPLREPHDDVPLDLAAVLNGAYDDGAYDLSIDYRKKTDPPLPTDHAKWVDKLLREKGLR